MQALYLEIKNLIISTLNLEELTPEDIDTDAAVLTHLITFGRKHYAVLIFYRQPQLKGVD